MKDKLNSISLRVSDKTYIPLDWIRLGEGNYLIKMDSIQAQAYSKWLKAKEEEEKAIE